MDRSDSSRTPRSRTVVEGHIRAPQTLSSEVSRCIHRLRVAHHRKSVFSGLRRSLLERIHSAIRSIFDAAAVQLSMEAPTCIAESRRHRSGMTGRETGSKLTQVGGVEQEQQRPKYGALRDATAKRPAHNVRWSMGLG